MPTKQAQLVAHAPTTPLPRLPNRSSVSANEDTSARAAGHAPRCHMAVNRSCAVVAVPPRQRGQRAACRHSRHCTRSFLCGPSRKASGHAGCAKAGVACYLQLRALRDVRPRRRNRACGEGGRGRGLSDGRAAAVAGRFERRRAGGGGEGRSGRGAPTAFSRQIRQWARTSTW